MNVKKGLCQNQVEVRESLKLTCLVRANGFLIMSEWMLDFERGVTTFPLPQQKIYLTPHTDLGFIYGEGTGPVILLGEHVGSGGTPCYAEMNELLGKHTAILGSTGAGKSGTVAALLHAVLDRGSDASHQDWHPQIVVLDPHNEYGHAFPDHVRLCTDEEFP